VPNIRITKIFATFYFTKKDFNVEAEWHFFATSHGKGLCDGIGGTVKRMARRASLQGGQQFRHRKLYLNGVMKIY
jgi:hypothetical protein